MPLLRRREEMAAFIAAQAPDLAATPAELELVEAFRCRLAPHDRLRMTPKFLHDIRGQVLSCRRCMAEEGFAAAPDCCPRLRRTGAGSAPHHSRSRCRGDEGH